MILDQAKAWGGKFVNAWSQDNIFAKRFRVWTKTKFRGTFSMSGPGLCFAFATFFHLWMRTALAGADDGGPRMTLVPQTLLLSSQVTFLSMNRSNQVSAFFLSMDKVKGFCHQFWGSGSGYLGVLGYIF